MQRLRFSGLALALVSLASCVSRPAPPPPPMPPAPPPRPAPAPPPPPPPRSWEDSEATPGDWTYRAAEGGSIASFGASAPVFSIACAADRRISLTRAGASGNGLTIRTSNAARTLAAAPDQSGLTAALNSADPLLDALAFSRGRFAVEASGTALLIVPAWPEPARVIEDCRG